MRATSSSVMLMIALVSVRRPLRRRSPAELMWERRRRCLCRRPRIIKVIVSDVRPTEPAMIATSRPRLIAMASRVRFRRVARMKPRPVELYGMCLMVVSTARSL